MTKPIGLTFYTKPDCPLCEDAERLLDEAKGQWNLVVRRYNIRTDPSVYATYKDRIPVLRFDSGPAIEAPITWQALVTALRSMGVTG
jgi:glutaredoxin